jgi:mycothiol synthase
MTKVTIRNYGPADLLALVELINEADRVDDAGFATTSVALGHRLADPGVTPAEDLLVAEMDGRLLGYALVHKHLEEAIHRIGVVGIVHPQWRRQGIGTALMQRAEERARAFRRDKPLVLEMIARGRVAGVAELALSLGLHPVRYFFYMQCHDLNSRPDPVLPPGVSMRTLDLLRDAEPLLAAYNDGFSDHWGYVPATRDQFQHLFDSPKFHAEDVLLAVTDQGCIAGLCIVLFPQMDPEMLQTNPPVIDDLAVPHAYRRRGIGRALLLAGMRHIRQRGFGAAALGVDADNPNQALKLYESVGFTVVSPSTAYHKDLAPPHRGAA